MMNLLNLCLLLVQLQKPFEPRLDDDIKGLLYGEILGNEVVFRRFDKESIERTVASGK